MIENIYNPRSVPSPAIQPNIHEKFIHTCTTKVPFYDPSGNIHIQIEAISMGSPVRSTISDFYMSYIEKKIIKTIITKPKIYVRNVDDIFITTHSYAVINKLKKL